MSDFLQLVDEVIDGTPEYTLTQKPMVSMTLNLQMK